MSRVVLYEWSWLVYANGGIIGGGNFPRIAGTVDRADPDVIVNGTRDNLNSFEC